MTHSERTKAPSPEMMGGFDPSLGVVKEAASQAPFDPKVEELRAAARIEAVSWRLALRGRHDFGRFKENRETALRALRKAERIMARLSAKNCRLPFESQQLIDCGQVVRSAVRETAAALQEKVLRRLTWVQTGERETIPRIYAVARRFLETSNFEEESLISYLRAWQERGPLDMNELWALKPMLQTVLIERARVAAMAFCRETAKARKTLSLQSESTQREMMPIASTLVEIEQADWLGIFESVSKTHKILLQDPSGVYPRMDAASRDVYRAAVSEIAAHSELSEVEIAAAAVDLAAQARPEPGEDGRLFERRKNTGYYLVDDGMSLLETRAHYAPPIHQQIERVLRRWPDFSYVLGIELLTVGIIAFLLSGLHQVLPPVGAIALLLLPATESAVRIMNLLTTFLLPAHRWVKLDFSDGIPSDCTTMVVVPTLLLTADQVRETVDDLEIRYLANADANLHFALLTDSPDSSHPLNEKDALVGLGVKLIEELNKKYGHRQRGSFFLFHRPHLYNPVEGAWMGWERKRGKLLDLNKLLRNKPVSFPVQAGDPRVLPKVRYVITLDSDTSLPRDAAHSLAGTLAHPLNRAVIDPETNTVVKGYGIVQPRVGVSVQAAARSRLASLLSGQSGFDLYTHAISDVYQDLFGEGSFTGKGIYEVDVYQQVLGERFPCNALLSHDLIEGSYARAGLASGTEVIDGYPSHFSAYSRRKHRWMRGDWQILRWLFNRVPGASGEAVPNPITFISRWKILDNLRRSLIEAAILALLLGGWFFLPGGARYWTVMTLVLLLMPTYLQLFLGMIAAGGSENWTGSLVEAVKSFVIEQVNVLFALVFLFHQALMTLDAIFRTVIRLAVTHKKLLEWETAAQAELKPHKKTPVEICLDLTLWLSIAVLGAMIYYRPSSVPEALPFLCVWACSKLIVRWVDRPFPSTRSHLAASDEALLRESALRTWRFFREWSHAGNNWLVPDHVQESPKLVAKIISPTNLGFLLTARLAAYDLGYLTVSEFAHLTGKTLDAAERMDRFKGHFFNWNSIETLAPVEPFFISTVDSGNLAACLWTLKQGCLEMMKEPIWRDVVCQGLRDLLDLMNKQAGKKWHTKGTATAFERLRTCLEEPAKHAGRVSAWIASLPKLSQMAVELRARLAEDPRIPAGSEIFCWAAELHDRLASLRKMTEEFFPWLLPEYKSLFLHPNTLPSLELSGLTLEALPGVLEDIERRLRTLIDRSQAEHTIRAKALAFLEMIPSALRNARTLMESLGRTAEISDSLVDEMDFGFVHHAERKLLSVGYDAAAQRLAKSCYDQLASEARMAAFIAIAKSDMRQQSWFSLGRRHTIYQGERVLLSWSGTMFEYLMPALWMKSYPDSILGESQRAVVICQQRFGQKKRRPWGVSEAAWSQRDVNGHYQYQAFGIPELALAPDIRAGVVAPYATFLALEADPEGAARNLGRMKQMGWTGTYGFYESADYRPVRRRKGAKCEIIRSWMPHHQGMILLALANLLAGSSIQRRFQAEPQFRASESMLHERVPGSVAVVPREISRLAHRILDPEEAATPAG